MSPFTAFDIACMRRALALAVRGRGRVEPNPMVAAVVARPDGDDGRVVGEGWHDRFGGPHAEVVALAAAGSAARGATLFVTLEPCCHQGKTPPCTAAIVASGVARVVVGARDPFPAVSGGGIAALRAAGLAVDVGLLEPEAIRLTAPFRSLVVHGRPWVIAKWAASLDGRLAGPPGAERWLSSPESRALVHELRGRVDGVIVGIGTALADDPRLTARPSGPRRAVRIVLDGRGRLPLGGNLVRTAREWPVLVAMGPDADAGRIAGLEAAGCEVWQGRDPEPGGRLEEFLAELGRRQLTNLLVEGGAKVLATCFARRLVDEVHGFVVPKLLGTAPALPVLPDPPPFDVEEVLVSGGDLFVRGLVSRPEVSGPAGLG